MYHLSRVLSRLIKSNDLLYSGLIVLYVLVTGILIFLAAYSASLEDIRFRLLLSPLLICLLPLPFLMLIKATKFFAKKPKNKYKKID